MNINDIRENNAVEKKALDKDIRENVKKLERMAILYNQHLLTHDEVLTTLHELTGELTSQINRYNELLTMSMCIDNIIGGFWEV